MRRSLLLLVVMFISFPCLSQEDEISVVARGYRDYFMQITDFSMSSFRYKYRGYGAQYEEQRINGVNFINLDNRMPLWNAQVGYSNNRRTYSFYSGSEFDSGHSFLGNIGGSDYLTTKPPTEQIIQVSGSVSNRSYSYRVGGVYANSWDNGLNLTLEASRRWGMSLSVAGVWSDAWTFAANVNKVFDNKHILDFSLIFAPNSRSTQRYATDEAFDLMANLSYNPNWGYQNKRQRSMRFYHTILPLATFSHSYQINKESSVETTLGAAFGQTSYSTLNWQNAPNPNPDYYRNMPSYQTDAFAKAELKMLWKTDPNVSQINFENIYQINATDKAHYIEEQRVTNVNQIILQSVYGFKNDKIALSSGVDFSYVNELRFKKLTDLFGAQYWLDIDYFLESDDDYRELTQNNVRNPNRRIEEGDEFGYSYRLQQLNVGLWGIAERRYKNWYFRVGLALKYHGLSRTGYYEKENFSGDQSYGESETLSKIETRIKAMVEYRLGTNFSAHLGINYLNLPPTPGNSFLDPNYRNALVENLNNESVSGFQLGFRYVRSNLKISLAAYATSILNSVEVTHFYDDLQGMYCDYVVKDIRKSYLGGEFSLEAQLFQSFWLNFAASIASNKYSSNPTGVEYNQTTGTKVLEEKLDYNGLHTALSPQVVGSIGVSYNPYGWTASLSLNGAMASYAAVAPIRYTDRAVYAAVNPIAMRNQEQLNGAISLDLFLGKTIEFINYSRLGLYAGINNITNTRFKTAAYQDNRLLRDEKRYSPMASKYYYGLGASFFFTATYTF